MTMNCSPFAALVVWSTFLLLSVATTTSAFNSVVTPNRAMTLAALRAETSATTEDQTNTQEDYQSSSIFDFTDPTAVDNFERIDDVIMGGISTSTIRSSSNDYASWSGVCRTDGGGFCGARTRTFEEGPLQVPPQATGFYIKARLASDDEPERRVWKISTRTEESRGEELFQAEFKVPSKQKQQQQTGDEKEWSLIQVPFDTFKRVRGARFVPDGSKMDVSNGIYQIGMTMSKFVMAENMTAIENFRDGYFELQVKDIGFIISSKNETVAPIPTPKTLPEEVVKRNRPLLLKMLIPIAKIFFSEQSQRRKSAMKILREKRDISSRASAIWFGIQVRRGSKKTNLVTSILQATKIVGIDSFRSIFSGILRYGLFYPLRRVSRLVKALKKGKESPKLAKETS